MYGVVHPAAHTPFFMSYSMYSISYFIPSVWSASMLLGFSSGPDLGIGKEGKCPPKCPACPTKHDAMQGRIGPFFLGLALNQAFIVPDKYLTNL